MPDGVLRVALTGGIATGKSYCLQRFDARGFPTIDADTLAREAVAVGSAGLSAVAARFGRSVLRADGHLDRPALGRIVFADAAARRDLEAIVHPFVFARVRAWFDALEARASRPAVGIADIPLLFETDSARQFDTVIVVACARSQQITRLMSRDGLDEVEATRRVDAQLPIADKRARADYLIDTSGSIAETDRQIEAVATRLAAARS